MLPPRPDFLWPSWAVELVAHYAATIHVSVG